MTASPPAPRRTVPRRGGAGLALLVGVWLALVALFGLLAENFLSAATFTTLAGRLPALVLVATGMTLVIIAGGIDLAVGSVAALSGAVLGVALTAWRWPAVAAVPLAVAVGAGAGCGGGLLSVALRLPSFLVTLGLLEVCRGLTYAVSGSKTIFLGGRLDALLRPLPGIGLPPTVLVALVLAAAAQLLLARTVLGRHLVAVGANEEAARLSGVGVGRTRLAAFAISGALAGLAGSLACARLGSADPNAGVGLELSAIAAAVIGGTTLSGGRGSVVGSVLGAIVIATLEAGLAQLGASEPMKRVVTGAVIVAAVAADGLRRRFAGDDA